MQTIMILEMKLTSQTVFVQWCQKNWVLSCKMRRNRVKEHKLHVRLKAQDHQSLNLQKEERGRSGSQLNLWGSLLNLLLMLPIKIVSNQLRSKIINNRKVYLKFKENLTIQGSRARVTSKASKKTNQVGTTKKALIQIIRCLLANRYAL